MKFCEKCDNMYYIRIAESDESTLNYYCKHCGNVDLDINQDGVCLMNTSFTNGEQNFHHIINKYTQLDPTLPRVYNIPCPNKECKTNHKDTKTPAEILYMRYNDAGMKYSYICSECDTKWTNN